MLSGMNSGHAKLADWGFTYLPAITPSNAVDLGCGGGRNAGELLKKYPKAHVTAIDYSDLSVEKGGWGCAWFIPSVAASMYTRLFSSPQSFLL